MGKMFGARKAASISKSDFKAYSQERAINAELQKFSVRNL